MKTSTLILNHLLPQESVELGRLVTSIHDPMQDYCPTNPLPLPKGAVSTQRLGNFSTMLQKSTSSGVSAFLTQLLSGSWAVSRGVKTDIAATTYETHQLGNCEEVLRSACQLAAVRNWLERAVRRRRNVYMICGVKVLVDAHIQQSLAKSSDKGGSIQVPGTLIAAAAGVPLPLDDTLDIGIKRTFKKGSQEQVGYHANGSHVFAIQYRKVKVGKFSTKDVDSTYLLEGSRWKVYVSTRGGPTTDEDDGMDVAAGEPVDVHDIKRPYERFEMGDEEILFCS